MTCFWGNSNIRLWPNKFVVSYKSSLCSGNSCEGKKGKTLMEKYILSVHDLVSRPRIQHFLKKELFFINRKKILKSLSGWYQSKILKVFNECISEETQRYCFVLLLSRSPTHVWIRQREDGDRDVHIRKGLKKLSINLPEPGNYRQYSSARINESATSLTNPKMPWARIEIVSTS